MEVQSFVYPPTPHNIDEKILQPSTEFKKEVMKVMGAIAFFVVVYLTLLVAAIGLAVLCAYGGIMLITIFPRFLTIMLGLGVLGLGVMVLFFLVKFVFSRNRADQSHLTRITKKDQPELFAFIKKLTVEVGAPFPKKIFLSNEVNAYVFYNSSFWSMFFPVRKNLVIGLGLVNGVNASEFKAILAHEFGHFSQRSMALGSYVYNVNQIIYNMLYDNKGLGESLEAWGNLHSSFSFFAALTEGIITGIQAILKKVYAIVNKSYMGLSRQMEFHADSVAAFVSGSDSLITALRRLEIADAYYQQLLQKYNEWIGRNMKPKNLFPHHLELLKAFAEKNNLSHTHGLPNVNAQFFQSMNTSRLVIKNQWASHPSTNDREAHLKALDIKAEISELPAWTLFKDPETLQREMTDFIFQEVKFTATPTLIDEEAFKKDYHEELDHYSFDKAYRGFYDNRVFPSSEEIEGATDISLESLLTDETLSISKKLNGIDSDLSTLEQIQNTPNAVKTFEFSGIKCTQEEAGSLITKLKREKEELTSLLRKTDDRVYTYFQLRARQLNLETEFKARHQRIHDFRTETEKDIEIYDDLIRIVTPVYQSGVTFEKAHTISNQLKIYEEKMKLRIKQFLSDPEHENFISKEKLKTWGDYISRERVYFENSKFNEEALSLLSDSLSAFYRYVNDKAHLMKKELLAWQLSLK
jgi:Zn-dependent protease with chaperone function